MSENLSDAFIILAVGMITVFVILALVVLTGKLLIQITNRYAPPSPIIDNSNSQQGITSTPKTTTNPTNSSHLNKKKIAAIIGAVDHITQGKGQIKNIQKL